MSITVFLPTSPEKEKFIQKIREFGYESYVDGKHGDDYNWLANNQENVFYFCFDGSNVTENTYDGVKRKNEKMVPCDLMLYPRIKNEDDLLTLITWVRLILEDGMIPDISEIIPPNITQVSSSEDYKGWVTVDPAYNLRWEEHQGIYVYEITKNNADRPYVVVNNMFDVHGHKYLFSSMYKFNDWGRDANPLDDAYMKWVCND